MPDHHDDNVYGVDNVHNVCGVIQYGRLLYTVPHTTVYCTLQCAFSVPSGRIVDIVSVPSLRMSLISSSYQSGQAWGLSEGQRCKALSFHDLKDNALHDHGKIPYGCLLNFNSIIQDFSRLTNIITMLMLLLI